MKKKIVLTFILMSYMYVHSQDFSLYEKRVFKYKKETLSYRILYPKDYDINKEYPLVLFLHGAGERGSDNEKQLSHGASLFLDSIQRNDYPAIVIFPQCPAEKTWSPRIINYVDNERVFSFKKKALRPSFLVKKLMNEVRKKEAVNKNEIYIMGLSMGAMGTFDMCMRHPRFFRAAVAICGGADNEQLRKIKHMPIRIYHGDKDDVVSVKHSRTAYEKLKSLGANVEYIEYKDINHESWNNAFQEEDFLIWLYEK